MKAAAEPTPADAKPADVEFKPGRVLFAQSEIEARIRAELLRPTEFDYQDIELKAVVQDLQTRHKIPIALDFAALTADGKGEETLINAAAAGGSLRAALNAMLSPLNLTYTVVNDQLLITTRTAAETVTSTRVYQVQDLVIAAADTNASQVAFDPLTELITRSIDPETWREAGGTQGDIVPLEANGVMALVITQTEAVHEKIEQLLTDIRTAKDDKVRDVQRRRPLPPPPEPKPNPKSAHLAETEPGTATPPIPPTPPKQIEQIVKANNSLAIELHRRFSVQAGGEQNLLFSPLGVLNAVTPVYLGAAGTTEAEFQQALQLPPSAAAADELSQLNRWLTAVTPLRRYSLRHRTRLFVQHDERLLASFVEANRSYFNLVPTPLDFRDPTRSKTQITAALREDAGGFLDPTGFADGLNADTRISVLNVVHFCGPWHKPFSQSATGAAPFHGPNKLQTLLMETTEKLQYAEVNDVQIVRKPYDSTRESGEVAFYVLLPKKDGLKRLEAGLTLAQLDVRIQSLKPTLVRLYLPKFVFENQFDVGAALQELGLKTALENSAATTADFSRINGERNLRLQQVLQRAKIEVNERETQAVAMTGVFGGAGGGIDNDVPIEVRCDRPFLFLIRDDTTGAILFLGRMTSPTEAPADALPLRAPRNRRLGDNAF